jgi:hypothetical protein
MEPADDILVDFASPCGAFKLTFADDGKVAYAYLKRGSTILGDVWVYNRCPTPEQPEWKDRRNLPFANCREFMREEGRFAKAAALADIHVEWQYTAGQPKALVYLSGALAALVGVNDKPGYCRFASKDGPLAKVLAVPEH